MKREKNESRQKFVGKNRGGKPLGPPNATSQRIIELFGDKPIFSGIHVTAVLS